MGWYRVRDPYVDADRSQMTAGPVTLQGNSEVRFLFQDSKKHIWIGTTKNVYRLEPGNLTATPLRDRDGVLMEETFIEMIESSQGDFWLSTEGQGVYRLQAPAGGDFRITRYRQTNDQRTNIGSDRANAILEDARGLIWMAAENNGIMCYDPDQDLLYHYQSEKFDPNSLSSNSIWEIYEDQSDRMWLGTYNKGLSVMDPQERKFSQVSQRFFSANGLSNDAVTSFMEESQRIWVGTDGGGISIWDPDRQGFSYLQSKPNQPRSLGSNAVLDLYRDSRGTIWVATWAGGLNRYDGQGRFTRLMMQENDPSSIPSNMVFALAEDKHDQLWVALWNKGIARYNPEDQTFFSINKATYGDSIWVSDFTNDLLIDQNNEFWIGTETGLNRLTFQSDEQFHVTSYLHEADNLNSLSNNIVNQVFEDQAGHIWVCTAIGLNLYQPTTNDFVRFDKQAGLPANFIQSIIQDPVGDYWVTTNKGISKMTSDTKGWHFKNYDRTDGVQGDNFTRGASFVASDENILLGGTNGFNYFTTDRVRENPNPPRVHFTKLRVFNEEITGYGEQSPLKKHINIADEIVLTHHQNVFSIEYVGVSMTHADKHTYAFQL